jgi:predicted nucleotidyltransferase
VNAVIESHQVEIADFCRRWGVTELAVFGSVLRDDFGPASDLDVLVSLDDSSRHTLFDLHHMQEDLGLIFRREVDLVSRRGIERSSNHIRRQAILESAQTVYGS